VTGEAALRLRMTDVEDADALFAAGAQAVKQGLEDAALPILSAAVERHPDDARLWQVLGLAHRRREALAPAVAAFEKAAALAPRNALIVHGLARARLEAGLPAVASFERALALAPRDEGIILGLLAAKFAERGVGDAIADLEARLAADPGWLAGHRLLGRLHWLKGERETFAASFEAAVLSAPRDLMVWREWADALLHAERYDEVLALVARGRAAAGDHPVFDGLEVIAVAEKGETGTADALFARLGPIGHIGLAVRYLRHLLRSGRPAEAAGFGAQWLADPEADAVWPYLATAWRLTADPRWQSLEGDERLVGVYDLGEAIPSLDALAARLRTLHQAVGQPLDQSVRGGTQTDGPLLSRIEPEIGALRAAIVAAVERHVARLPAPRRGHPTLLGKRAPIRFAGSWSVRLTGAGFHANHLHPQGWLSSAFYVSLPERMGAGEAGWLKLGEPEAALGLDLAPFRTVEPKPGRLVLFPSTMWHGTVPFAEGERLTVAFDVAKPPQ
jgi:tetratricopeptide (TPR) repeat protein